MVDDSHLATGDRLSVMLNDAVHEVGLTAEILVVDLAQRVLNPLSPHASPPIPVEGTVAGRVYQLGEVLPATDGNGDRLLWVPMLDGTERIGVLRIGLGEGVIDDQELRKWCWSLAGLMGHIFMTKIAYSDRLRGLRTNRTLSVPSELLWQLLPPRTFASERIVVTALLEPPDRVAGDAYDYAADSTTLDLAVFDAVGHDLQACLTTALAITAIRNTRRAGETDLAIQANRASQLILEQPGSLRFVTAVLARLNTETGLLRYLLAGHPPPLLVRGGRVVKQLAHPPRRPLGFAPAPTADQAIAEEQLEPGDRLLLYSDGVIEARDPNGEFFGEQRLVDFTERASLAELSAPETLRRLTAAVLVHQSGQLQDDATLLLVDWSANAHRRMSPSL
ncbi:MAG TPA: PP2C family protein-serine/threonine phosphatase [Pseudonocardiaceae bacterium]|nr:PP2C family protein-serine/threonine phosphatase [Pseudonocardiaceae bacterium]